MATNNPDLETELFNAALMGHADSVERLLKEVSVHTKNKNGQTPLHLAAQHGHKNVVKLLLANGAELNAKDEKGQTPLHNAAQMGHQHIVVRLLANGAELDAKDEIGQTALHYAFGNNRRAIAKLLIALGADIEAKTAVKNESPLNCVSAEENYDFFASLVENVPQIKKEFSNFLETELFEAVKNHNCRAIIALLRQGVNVNCVNDSRRETPLHLAAARDHKYVVELLLANGADINAKDKEGQTALHLAVENGYKNVIELLLANGADINAENEIGQTPLHYAFGNKRRAIAELLIALGANIEAKTAVKNELPLDCVSAEENHELFAHLGKNVSQIKKQYSIFLKGELFRAVKNKNVELLLEESAESSSSMPPRRDFSPDESSMASSSQGPSNGEGIQLNNAQLMKQLGGLWNNNSKSSNENRPSTIVKIQNYVK